MNDSGAVVGVSNSASGSHGYFYDGSLTDVSLLLAPLGASFTSVQDVNSSNEVVGLATTASGDLHAFLFTGGAMTDVNTLLPAGSPGSSTRPTTSTTRDRSSAAVTSEPTITRTS